MSLDDILSRMTADLEPVIAAYESTRTAAQARGYLDLVFVEAEQHTDDEDVPQVVRIFQATCPRCFAVVRSHRWDDHTATHAPRPAS